MRRQLDDTDFPLSLVGTVIFAAADPVPLFVGDNVDATHTLFRLVTLGYECSAIVARSQDPAIVGPAVIDLFVSPQQELPLAENEGWTLDRSVNRS